MNKPTQYKDVTNGIFTVMFNNDNGKFTDLFGALTPNNLDTIFTNRYSQAFLGVDISEYENYVLQIYNTYYDLWINFAQKLIDSPFFGTTETETLQVNGNKQTDDFNKLVNDTDVSNNGRVIVNSNDIKTKTVVNATNDLVKELQVRNDMQTYDLVRDKIVSMLFLKIY